MAKGAKVWPGKATTRSTSGSGFAFEDLVAADLLSRLLIDAPIAGIGLPGAAVYFQTSAAGWLLDDLLCVGQSVDDGQSRLAISCKSNVQVSANGLPGEFAEAAWRQWNAGPPFDRTHDRIALVTRGRHIRFDALWHDIKGWASGDAGLAIARINVSAAHRRVYDSVLRAAPGKNAVSEEEAIALIARLEVYPLDFQLSPSCDLESAVLRCRSALASANNDEAEKLWESLVRMAEAARLGSGVVPLEQLLAQAGRAYRLAAHPSVTASWARLQAISDDHRAGIHVALPNGWQLPREVESEALVGALASAGRCLVTGDSGVGKSALVKTTLDQRFPDAIQIWLGPDALSQTLSEVEPLSIGLGRSLAEVVTRGPTGLKVLVIDSAERLSGTTLARLSAMLGLLKADETEQAQAVQVIIVTQAPDEASEAVLITAAGFWPRLHIGTLERPEVANALFATPQLRWIADDEQILAALANFQVLAWVIRSASSFTAAEPNVFASTVTIIDRLWDRWTGGSANLQRLVIRLAERDAAFERSFAISELEGSDSAAFDSRTAELPLVVNSRRRIEFAHDLASDWARFQRLKEIADDVPRWSALAPQPLWVPALRLVGQFLLTEPDQARRGWDHAFATITAAKNLAAADLLLDALCLDSKLDEHLEARKNLFLADGGALLKRLLNRFILVASVPNVPLVPGEHSNLRIYLEADMRKPIFGRWFPLGRFLARNADAVGELGLDVVSRICGIWLNSTPCAIDGRPVPLRDVMARVALATGRAEQISSVAHRFGGRGDYAKRIYTTALAGAAELPAEVSDFALEMARRRPLAGPILARVHALRERDRQQLAAIRAASPRRRAPPPPVFLSSRRDLPPWPLGPQGRVVGAFRDAVVHGQALTPLMLTAPHAAAEVLLACIIDANPHEEYGSSRLHEDLGLEFDSDSYPTFFTKSAFFSFLQNQPDIALETFKVLLTFAMERWASTAPPGVTIPAISVSLASGEIRTFPGNAYVFGWSQHNSTSSGQLFCALDALERWLALKADAGEDMERWCQRLLEMETSTAILGVLVNLGKRRPALFGRVLTPLLAVEALYWWDSGRVQSVSMNFIPWSWVRLGDAVFNLARDWTLAPHRRVPLREVVMHLIVENPELAAKVLAGASRWVTPGDQKAALEQRALRAQLDPANYQPFKDEASGESGYEFAYPSPLAEDLEAYQIDAARRLQPITLPYQCETILAGSDPLTPANADYLATLLPNVLPDDEDTRRMVAAASATLIARGGTWKTGHPEAVRMAERLISSIADSVGDTFEELRDPIYKPGRETLRFAAIGALYAGLAADEPARWDQAILRLLTSGDPRAIGALMAEASRNRERLGSVWHRLLFLLVLAAALNHLGPDWESDDTAPDRWSRWLARLRILPLFGYTAESSTFDPAGIARRTERILEHRRARASEFHRARGGRGRRFAGLSSHLLEAGFQWLLDYENGDTIAQDRENRQLLGDLWAFEAWRISDDVHSGDEADEDDEEYDLPSELGYAILRIAPAAVLAGEPDETEPLWRSIFGLGPLGYVAIEQFLSGWFLLLFKSPDPDRFMAQWARFLAVASEADWPSHRFWFRGREIWRKLLALDATRELGQAPGIRDRLPELADTYRRWATETMGGEDEVAAFAYFVGSPAGRPFRLDGMVWLNLALAKQGRDLPVSAANSIAEAIDVLLNEDGGSLVARQDVREAVIAIVARLMRGQVPTAMGLQARIGALR